MKLQLIAKIVPIFLLVVIFKLFKVVARLAVVVPVENFSICYQVNLSVLICIHRDDMWTIRRLNHNESIPNFQSSLLDLSLNIGIIISICVLFIEHKRD